MTTPEAELIGQKLIRETLEKALDSSIENWDRAAIQKEVEKFRKDYKYSWDNDYSSVGDLHYRQIAYALTYYPLYIYQTNVIIDKELPDLCIFDKDWIQTKDQISLAFIGSGPCPECLGLLNEMDSRFGRDVNISQVPSFQIDLFDIEPDWKWLLENLTFQLISQGKNGLFKKLYDTGKLEFTRYLGDLSDPDFPDKIDKKKLGHRGYDLVIGQNFLNEVSKSKIPQITANMRYFLPGISGNPAKCILILSMRGGGVMDETIKNMKTAIQSNENENGSSGKLSLHSYRDVFTRKPDDPVVSEKIFSWNQWNLVEGRHNSYESLVVRRD